MSDTSLSEEMRIYWRETARVIALGATILLLLGAVSLAAKAAFPKAFINVQSVTIPNHAVGEDPEIEVFRWIASDFRGAWSTEIRQAKTHGFVCQTPGLTIEYKKEANARNPLPTALSKWVLDQKAIERCVDRGFGAGFFYLITCHKAKYLDLFQVVRCRDSNVFERTPRRMEG